MTNPQTTAIAERPVAHAEPITLDDFFAEALRYGRVGLRTTDKGTFWATIEFETIPGTVLKAEHPGYTPTPHEALRLAIGNAKEIRKAFK